MVGGVAPAFSKRSVLTSMARAEAATGRPISLAVDYGRRHECVDESRLEFRRKIGIQRLCQALGGKVDEPAGADDRDVRRLAAGDIRGQSLQQRIPGHDLDVDMNVGIFLFEGCSHFLVVRAGLRAVFGNGEVDFGSAACALVPAKPTANAEAAKAFQNTDVISFVLLLGVSASSSAEMGSADR